MNLSDLYHDEIVMRSMFRKFAKYNNYKFALFEEFSLLVIFLLLHTLVERSDKTEHANCTLSFSV